MLLLIQYQADFDSAPQNKLRSWNKSE